MMLEKHEIFVPKAGATLRQILEQLPLTPYESAAIIGNHNPKENLDRIFTPPRMFYVHMLLHDQLGRSLGVPKQWEIHLTPIEDDDLLEDFYWNQPVYVEARR
jgi:hypothetical protein